MSDTQKIKGHLLIPVSTVLGQHSCSRTGLLLFAGSNKLFNTDPGLLKSVSQCADGQLLVPRDDTACIPAAQHNMTAPLPCLQKS